MTRVDIHTLDEVVASGYLSRHSHPEDANLFIYNYTQRAQFDHVWTPITLMCRGLIVRSDGEIVARPFPKFFNWEEYQGQIPAEDFAVSEKLDGSLGILYWLDGKPRLATRGSFISEQAVRGTKMLQERYGDFPFVPGFTYLFEILYPENRIVVDYGGREDIVLLAVIETATGDELAIHQQAWPFPVARYYDGISDLTTLRELEEANHEGFVIRFASGLRLKVKFAEYVRLHRLVTQINARHIWELLANGSDIGTVLDHVPDEFYAWLRATEAALRGEYARIESYCQEVAAQASRLPSRKEQAAVVTTTSYPAVVFKMLDGKSPSEAIWKLLKPAAEKPFREEI